MTDIHCHILPCVDDGASSWEEALNMARCAFSEGIRQIVCTPHMNAEEDSPDMLAGYDFLRCRLQRCLNEEGISVQLMRGAEWKLTPNIPKAFFEKGCLGSGRAFLFEVSSFMPPAMAEPFVEEAVCAGLRPVMAHPERHPWLTGMHEEHRSLLEKLAARGCVFQLTAGSFDGFFGRQIRRAAESMALMFPHNVVLASDAHNMHGRRPYLLGGYKALEKLRPGLDEQAKRTLNTVLCSG